MLDHLAERVSRARLHSCLLYSVNSNLPKYNKSGGMNNTVHILGISVVVIESFACTSITSTYVAMRQFNSKLPLLV